MRKRRLFALALALCILVGSVPVMHAAVKELNVMQGAFYIGQFNLNEESYSDSALGGVSDPSKMVDGLYGKGPTNKDTGLNARVVDKTATYSADGKPMSTGEYLWGITYRLNREYEIDSFALMVDDLSKFDVGIIDTVPWMPMGFDLLVSETGEDGSWQVVHRARDLHTETSPGKYTYVPALMGHHMGYYTYSASFTPVKAKYVRFASTSLTCPNFDKSHWINIAELQVFGEMELLDASPIPKEEGNVMRDSTFVQSYNIREDLYAPSVYGGTSSPLKMIDGRYGMGPTQMDDSFHGMVEIPSLATDKNHGVESYAPIYNWYTMFALDKEYTIDRFSLMTDDLTTCSIGDVNPVQYLLKGFDILVSDTGETGSWTVAYSVCNAHTSTDKGLYSYVAPSEEHPLGYYQLEDTFTPIKAKYICLAGPERPYQNAAGEYWVEIAEFQVFETDKEPPAPPQTVLPEGENMMLRAEYLSAINLRAKEYTIHLDGIKSDPARLIDGKWASNRTYTMESLNTCIDDLTAHYNADGQKDNAGEYKWMATYKLNQRHLLNGFRLITFDMSPFIGDTNPVQWLQRDFDILISDTGNDGSWQVLYSAENLHTEENPGAYVYHPASIEKTGYYELTVNFPETEGAWFIRFASRSLTSDVIDSAHWVNISELEVYGEVDKAAGNIPSDGKIDWNLSEDGTLTVTGNGKMSNWDFGEAPWYYQANKILRVVIGEGVTSVGDYSFYNCSNLTSVSLSSTLTRIGHDAFSNCASLAFLQIPSGVVSIGNNAFIACSRIPSVTLPDTVTTVGGGAFADCTSLTSVTLPKNLTKIPGAMFRNCYSLKEITIPEGVTEIGEYAFKNCGLTTVKIPDSVTALGNEIFADCTSLTSVTLPKNITKIPSGMFRYCFALKEITIPEGVTEIGGSAFADCRNLTSIEIPDTVTAVGIYAFSGCEAMTDVTLSKNITKIPSGMFYNGFALKEITIPEGVTEIGEYAFYQCRSLTSAEMPDTVSKLGNEVFYGCSALQSFILPKGITDIPYGAFWDCSALKEITIPEGATGIGERAFVNCYALSDVTIPDSMRIIGDYAFYGCRGMEAVILGESVIQIGSRAFEDCASVKRVYIPAATRSIGESAFLGMSRLETIVVDSANPAYMADINGILFTKDRTTLLLYPAGRTAAEYTIPYGVVNIGQSAFSGSSLTRLVLPRSVKKVNYYAFNNCSRLTDMVVLSRDVDWMNSPPSTATLYCYAGSSTETYANTYHRSFQLIQEGGVFGRVTTQNPGVKATVRLMAGDTVYCTGVIEAESGVGSVTQYFHLYGAPTQPDVLYDVVIEKEGHLSYTITGISLVNGEIDLTAQMDESLSNITVPAGDINDDGCIDLRDLVALTSDLNFGLSYEKAADKSADVNGDRSFDLRDLVIITSDAGYGRAPICVQFGK